MAKAKNTPLTQVDLQNLNNALKQALELRLHIANAKQVGIDTEPFEQQLAYYENNLNSMKTTYFPNGM